MAREVRDCAREHRLTQKQLAAAGINQAEISRIERDQANPTASTLAALLATLAARVGVVPRETRELPHVKEVSRRARHGLILARLFGVRATGRGANFAICGDRPFPRADRRLARWLPVQARRGCPVRAASHRAHRTARASRGLPRRSK